MICSDVHEDLNSCKSCHVPENPICIEPVKVDRTPWKVSSSSASSMLLPRKLFERRSLLRRIQSVATPPTQRTQSNRAATTEITSNLRVAVRLHCIEARHVITKATEAA